MNSGWRIASRSFPSVPQGNLPFVNAGLLPERFQRHRRHSFRESALESLEEPLGISRRAQKVGGLQEAGELRRRDQGHVLGRPALDDHRLPGRRDLVAQRSEPCSGIGVCRHRHVTPPILYRNIVQLKTGVVQALRLAGPVPGVKVTDSSYMQSRAEISEAAEHFFPHHRGNRRCLEARNRPDYLEQC